MLYKIYSVFYTLCKHIYKLYMLWQLAVAMAMAVGGPDHIFSMLHNMCSRLYGYMAVRVCVGCTTIRLCDYMAK